MWSIYHKFSKRIFLKSHSNSSHLSNYHASIEHMISPWIHNSFPLREIFRWLIWYCILRISDIPKVSPFSISRRRYWGVCFILFSEAFDKIRMCSGFLFIFWSGSNLIFILRIHVINFFSFIKICWSFPKILFHHIDEYRILLLIDSWIFYNNASELSQSLSYFFALLQTLLSVHITLNINYWNF